MKSLIRILLVTFLISITLSLNSQNLYNYSLSNQNPEVYNPSAILNDDVASFYLSSRLQWAGIDGFPKYNTLGGSHSISPKMSIGGAIFNSTHGVINNLKAKVSYAYRIVFSKEHYITMGLSMGIVNDKLFFSQLQYVDLTDNIIQPNNYNKLSFTSAFGFSYKLKKFEMQFILPQLYEYNEINLYGIGVFSYNFIINNTINFKPSVLVRNTELGNVQSDLMLNIQWRKKIWFQAGARTNGNLIFGVGNQTIGYAFETPAFNMLGNTIGTHEILLKFRIKKDEVCPSYELY
jgi:type IX secretion system PorP/SprF family membrane protein